jgi:hypothetical protein
MKLSNVLLVGGVIAIGYFLLRKKPKVINVEPDITKKDVEKPRTIVLSLSEPQKKVNTFYDDVYVRDFNASKFSTVAPPSVTIKSNF